MTKKVVRGLALSLTLLQLFSFGKAKLNLHHELPNKQATQRVGSTIKEDNYFHIVEVKNENGEVEYRRLENNEERPISIFDEENIDSKQYGGNQLDMKNHFKELIDIPEIKEEMEKEFPTSSFPTIYEKRGFDRAYFESICQNGCNYVAAINFIFKQFEGKEKEFEETFGFPMYTVKENGFIDFNYEILLLKFFNHSLLKEEGLRENVEKGLAKQALSYAYEEFKKEEFTLPKNFRELSEEEQQAYYDAYNNREKIADEIRERLDNAHFYPKEYTDFGLSMHQLTISLKSFLKKYGINTSGNIQCNAQEPFKLLDFLAGNKYALYYDEGNILYDPNVKYHAIMVTGETENGYTPVSSWGLKLYYDAEQSEYTTKVYMKSFQ